VLFLSKISIFRHNLSANIYSEEYYMAKKYVLKIIVYAALFSLFTLAEKALGLYGISIGFLFALLFCREKIFIALPCFLLAETLIPFSLNGLIYASGAVGVYVVDFVIHRLKKFKYAFWEIAILIVLSMAPYIGLQFAPTLSAALKIILSTAIALGCGYAGILACYPVLIRGIRYKPSTGEVFCMGIFVGIAGIGLGGFELFNVKPYYFVAAFLLVFLRGTEKNAVLPFGVASALGAAVGCGETAPLCAVTAAALILSGADNLKIPFGALAMAVAFFISSVFFVGFIDLYSVIPFCVGAAVAACIPEKALKKLFVSRQGYVGRYAMRMVVNRDREEISDRIGKVASAFSEMRDILCDEADAAPDFSVVTDSVCRSICAECNHCAKCLEKFDVRNAVDKLTNAALKNGKATLLDVGVSLGENCRHTAKLISAVNDGAAEYVKMAEKRKEIGLGREMVISQMGGMALLLESMSKSVKTGISFDADRERLLTERLAQSNIIAADVMLYKSEDGAEAALVVRKNDADKPALKSIISHLFGVKMMEYARKTEINGMVGLSFCKAPQYKIMYGESVYAKEERCGDTRQAVKIGKNKVMFVLSDGMGTGKSAFLTSSNIICLIETFYKAGFDHKTIFTSVSGMLALRTKEDFSALDVVVVDLSTGDADFIKQGGRESCILSEKGCEVIEGGTLPIGILADSEPKIERRRISRDETVILMSDGVADALTCDEITAIAVNTGLHNPKAVADEIVKNAGAKNGNSSDDMTVMALRLIDGDK